MFNHSGRCFFSYLFIYLWPCLTVFWHVPRTWLTMLIHVFFIPASNLWPRLTMFKHDFFCHGQRWSNMFLFHGQPWSIAAYIRAAWPCLIMVILCAIYRSWLTIVKPWLYHCQTMVGHGWKSCLTMVRPWFIPTSFPGLLPWGRGWVYPWFSRRGCKEKSYLESLRQ